MNRIPIELLSPAKDVACGIAAIDHGADAVYIGAPRFGARTSASNTLQDIAQLITYAHRFHARVYIAFNTVLYDDELPEAVELAHTLYDMGVDALIIQDMGLLQCALPPIPLHASTQMHNASVEKVAFLQSQGFSQVVLARELSLQQIQTIRENTHVPLEFFVHGAICVCYSGQCYMSAFATNRSGNRGECAQMCRHKYRLQGIAQYEGESAYYLSPQDLHLGNYVGDLLRAGIQSFKIEGRLKDSNYVKNITAYFRRLIDKEIAANLQYVRASHGIETVSFEPDIYKTFSRGFTDYYIANTRNAIANLHSPKSIGEYIGTVQNSSGELLHIATNTVLNNGDGLCYVNENHELCGMRVNEVHATTIRLLQPVSLAKGTPVWRNYSIEFEKKLSQSAACRKVPINAVIGETADGFSLSLSDVYGNSICVEQQFEKQAARNPEKIEATIRAQISKMGDTLFELNSLTIEISQLFFIPISVLNDIRRNAVRTLEQKRLDAYPKALQERVANTIDFPRSEHTDFRLNITNHKAREFYEQHGLTEIEMGYELTKKAAVPLMKTKYCIRYQLDACPRINPLIAKADPIILSDNVHSFRVEFDCASCHMNVYAADSQ